jgi:hypothetical protein
MDERPAQIATISQCIDHCFALAWYFSMMPKCSRTDCYWSALVVPRCYYGAEGAVLRIDWKDVGLLMKGNRRGLGRAVVARSARVRALDMSNLLRVNSLATRAAIKERNGPENDAPCNFAEPPYAEIREKVQGRSDYVHFLTV